VGQLPEQVESTDLRFYPCKIPILKKTCNPLVWIYFCLKATIITIRLLGIIKKEQIEIIYANSFTACLFCGSAAKFSRTTLIWHMRDLIRCSLFNKLFVALAGKWSNKVIATTSVMKHNLISCSVLPERIKVVHNGIDLDEYDRTKVDRTWFRNEIGVDIDTPLIGIVGQLTQWKGHQDFLQAACTMIKTIPQAKFLIVGDTRLPKDNTYRLELEDLVKALNLDRNVIFTGFREDIRDVIGSFDILVNASWAEPFGRTIIEAMALGVPVIATKAGGIQEIITDGVDGLLFTMGDAEQLAQISLNILANSSQAKKITQNASRTVADRFSLAHQVTRIENIILNC
jgi:glycosyltransferase involved in cell wall biosynthesis